MTRVKFPESHRCGWRMIKWHLGDYTRRFVVHNGGVSPEGFFSVLRDL